MSAGMAPTPKNLRISCPQIPAQTRVLKKQPGPKSLSLVWPTFGITELNYFKLQGFLRGGLKKKKKKQGFPKELHHRLFPRFLSAQRVCCGQVILGSTSIFGDSQHTKS